MKTKCAVRGMIQPGAMCGSVIVGGQFCGNAGPCEHKMIAAKWYAIKQEGGEVVATGSTYREVSDAAFAAMPWGGNPAGEVAPYYLTTLAPA